MNLPNVGDRLDILAFHTASIGWALLIIGAIVKVVFCGERTQFRPVLGKLSFWLIAPGAFHIAIAASILAVGLMINISINDDPHNNLLPFYAAMFLVLIVAAPILPIHFAAGILLPDLYRNTGSFYQVVMAVLDGYLWVCILVLGKRLLLKLRLRQTMHQPRVSKLMPRKEDASPFACDGEDG